MWDARHEGVDLRINKTMYTINKCMIFKIRKTTIPVMIKVKHVTKHVRFTK